MARAISSLRRRTHVREPKRHFSIFCEGKNTEPNYFTALRKACPNVLVAVSIVSAVGVPYTIAEVAIKEAKRRKISSKRKPEASFEEADQVWAVFDRDAHPRYQEAVNLCATKNVNVARSNPCFEVWLILHENDFNKSCDRHSVQEHLRTLRPEYDPKSSKNVDCGQLICRIEDAERRADDLLAWREAEGTAFGPPSTTVHWLTRAIRKAAKNTK